MGRDVKDSIFLKQEVQSFHTNTFVPALTAQSVSLDFHVPKLKLTLACWPKSTEQRNQKKREIQLLIWASPIVSTMVVDYAVYVVHDKAWSATTG